MKKNEFLLYYGDGWIKKNKRIKEWYKLLFYKIIIKIDFIKRN